MFENKTLWLKNKVLLSRYPFCCSVANHKFHNFFNQTFNRRNSNWLYQINVCESRREWRNTRYLARCKNLEYTVIRKVPLAGELHVSGGTALLHLISHGMAIFIPGRIRRTSKKSQRETIFGGVKYSVYETATRGSEMRATSAIVHHEIL